MRTLRIASTVPVRSSCSGPFQLSVDLTELEQEAITIAAMRDPALVKALGECLDVLDCACQVNRSSGDLDPWFYGRARWRG